MYVIILVNAPTMAKLAASCKLAMFMTPAITSRVPITTCKFALTVTNVFWEEILSLKSGGFI